MPLRKAYCPLWYPKTLDEIKKYLTTPSLKSKKQFFFALAPHAGWIYSGKIAGKVYSQISQTDTVIILGTNHTGLGSPTSLFPEGEWEMPLGPIKIASEFSLELLQNSKQIKADIQAHLYEHAIEVQIPFLQAIAPNAKIVPIEMQDYRLEVCKEIADTIAKTISQALKRNPDQNFCVLSSSDMTHCGQNYGQEVPKKISASGFAETQDRMAIEEILQINPEKLLQIVEKQNITMCGAGPTAVMLETAKLLGAKNAELLGYATSRDLTGKKSEFAVGYAGVIIQ
ncbi:MAG: AmmeMemoRadiSam system protein B [Elusimicrobia bacterium]|nr:AmmeMemoRadiSam system protein B [Elusimicrobiota bacterium]